MFRASGWRFFFLFALVAFGCEILQTSSPFVRNPLTSLHASSFSVPVAAPAEGAPFDDDVEESWLEVSVLDAVVPSPPQVPVKPLIATSRRSVSCYPLSADLEQLKRPPRS